MYISGETYSYISGETYSRPIQALKNIEIKLSTILW